MMAMAMVQRRWKLSEMARQDRSLLKVLDISLRVRMDTDTQLDRKPHRLNRSWQTPLIHQVRSSVDNFNSKLQNVKQEYFSNMIILIRDQIRWKERFK